MSLLLCLAALLPAMVNLSFSVFVAWAFRKYPRPPVWVICFLLILGFGTFRLIFMAGPGFLLNLLSSLSAILCIVQALALTFQRWLGFSIRKSWVFSCLLMIPIVAWIDLRFSVLVMDENGNSVEVDTKRIEMQAMPRDILYHGYGNRLKKGVVYFGFCQWVRHREKWLVFGDAASPEGELFRHKNIESKANWGIWPLRITVDAKAP